MIKSSLHTIKGMQRDAAVSKFSSDFAFDAQNIRITARENSTLLSVTNEKGNKEIILKDTNKDVTGINGTVIGYNVLNEYVTLVRIKNAENLILNTNYHITDIATMCGFNDSGYFSVVFKKVKGISPLKLRMNNFT